MDGLRLDATHALVDDSPRHFLSELTAAVRAACPERTVHLIAEDSRNLRQMLLPVSRGGWGLDAVWADDFHHQLRRRLAGDHEGYYADYTGSVADIVTTLNKGWFFTGQTSSHLGQSRGTDPAGLEPAQFVICLQNHDQIGNRAFGDRLNQAISLGSYRAASAVLLLAPQTPLLFMGQEWAATSPFLYFTDHGKELGRAITAGRRHEFRHFAAFREKCNVEQIPDPQEPATFSRSKLKWSEKEAAPHRGVHELYAALLKLRSEWTGSRRRALALGADTLGLLLEHAAGKHCLVVAHLGQAATVEVANDAVALNDDVAWNLLLTTEDPRFAAGAAVPKVRFRRGGFAVTFFSPAALVIIDGGRTGHEE